MSADLDGNPSGEPCIIIYTREKIHVGLLQSGVVYPKTLTSKDGTLVAPTDVVVSLPGEAASSEPWLYGANRALVRQLRWQNGRQKFIGPGVQIGGGIVQNDQLSAYHGTVGFVVREKENHHRIGILTNQRKREVNRIYSCVCGSAILHPTRGRGRGCSVAGP